MSPNYLLYAVTEQVLKIAFKAHISLLYMTVRTSILNQSSPWGYEEVDTKYSSHPGFRDLVKDQCSFNKDHAKQIQ
jgi:hypothetical protein